MKCPNCGLENPDTAMRCDCGYDLLAGKTMDPYLNKPPLVSSTAAGLYIIASLLAPFVLCYGAIYSYAAVHYVISWVVDPSYYSYRYEPLTVSMSAKLIGILFGALTFTYVARPPWLTRFSLAQFESLPNVDQIKCIAWVICVMEIGMIIGQAIGATCAAVAFTMKLSTALVTVRVIVGAIGLAVSGVILWAIAGILGRENFRGVIILASIGALAGAITGAVFGSLPLLGASIMPCWAPIIWVIAGMLVKMKNSRKVGFWLPDGETIRWAVGAFLGGVVIVMFDFIYAM